MKKVHLVSDGFTAVEFLLVTITLAVIGTAGYFVAKHINDKTPPTTVASKNSTKTTPNSNTFSFDGFPYPVLPASYSLIYKDKSFGVMYLTKNNSSQIINDISKVCSADGYSSNNYVATIGNQNYTSQAMLCYGNSGKNSDIQWQINITAATNINYQTWKSQVSQSYLKELSSMNWVMITSSGPPIAT